MNHRTGAESYGNSLDAGNGTHPIVELAQSGARLGRSSGGSGRHREIEGDGVARGESGIHSPERGEAAKHQAGSNQQNQSHRQFESHEYLLQAMPLAARSAAALLEDVE